MKRTKRIFMAGAETYRNKKLDYFYDSHEFLYSSDRVVRYLINE